MQHAPPATDAPAHRDGAAIPTPTSLLTAAFDELATDQSVTTRGRTITESDIASFACLTGDSHPQHTDAAWASSSPFGERIAHGMLVLSYAFGLVPFDPDRVLALRAVRSAVFKRPVSIGDTIHAVAQVDRLATIDSSTGLVTLRIDVVNQRNRVVARGTVDVLWRRGDTALTPRIDEAFEMVGLPL